ncbi:CDP-glycerol glycerophosphotransferase family protein [Robertmurraya massiliosenegalensis]|uniref:CDP-glycerol glycerophosphotransferase family protein n=1 Tax=Robertmurraya TaxID=2837507 RepID=UPI0039A75F0B
MKIVLFGTGSTAENIKKQINGTVDIIAVTDNNKDKWGTPWYGHKVIAPKLLHEINYDCILICSMYTFEIIEGLLEIGIKRDKIVPYFDNVNWQKKYKEQTKIDKEVRSIILGENKSRKISLITRRNSGCNSLALYKNLRNTIQQEFDVSLVNLEEYKKNWEEYEIAFSTHMEGRMYKNRINIESWHGFPLKSLGVHEKNSVDNIENADKGIDYILSYSHLYSYIMSSVYKIDISKFINTGMPRNDLLINENSRNLLSSILNREIDTKKVFFYVPTFRKRINKNVNEGVSVISDYHEFEILDNFLQESNSFLVIKKHPVEEEGFKENIFKNILFMTDNDLSEHNIDFYEILGGSDLLITDYSSVYFDYLLLNRPIIFWTKDQDKYERERGFLFDHPETMMPGPIVKNVEGVIKAINKFLDKINWYSAERSKIKKMIHKYDDFNSSERVWDLILSIYKEGSQEVKTAGE